MVVVVAVVAGAGGGAGADGERVAARTDALGKHSIDLCCGHGINSAAQLGRRHGVEIRRFNVETDVHCSRR